MKHLEKFNIFAKKPSLNREMLYNLENKDVIWVYGFDNTKDLKKFIIKGNGSIIYIGKSDEITEQDFLDTIKPIKNKITDLNDNNLSTVISNLNNPPYIYIVIK